MEAEEHLVSRAHECGVVNSRSSYVRQGSVSKENKHRSGRLSEEGAKGQERGDPLFKDQSPEEDVFEEAIVGQGETCDVSMAEAGARLCMGLGLAI